MAVIIPTYNQWEYLPDALASVRAQTRPVDQIIVIDDGSDVPAPELGSDITLIRQINAGPAIARNRALAETQCDFVVPDADDELLPTFVETTLAVWQRARYRQRLAVIYTPALTFGDVTELRPAGLFDRRTLAPYNTIGQCALIRRDALNDVGGWCEELSPLGYEDWDLWLTLLEHGWTGRMHPHPLYRYRQHSGPRVNTRAETNRNLVLQIVDRRHPDTRNLAPVNLGSRAVHKTRAVHHRWQQTRRFRD